MGGSKSVDRGGVEAAQASADAANKAYQLGEQQLQWTKDTWAAEQPLMDASEKQQMALAAQQEASLKQSDAEAQQQYAAYEKTYAPLEASYVAEASNWDSPNAVADARGKAMSDVAEQGQAGINNAAETLRSYGINPGSGRYAALYAGAQPMLAASEAAAGTTAAQQLHAQKMALEGGAINTGRGLLNDTAALTNAGTGAGSAASESAKSGANTSMANLTTGSNALTAPTAWYNAGANNMNTFVGAMNSYNDEQYKMNALGAQEMAGVGSILGAIPGLMKVAKGGPIGYDDGGTVGDSDGGMSVVGSPGLGEHDPTAQLSTNPDALPPGTRPGPTITYPAGQRQQLLVGPPQPQFNMTAAQRQQQGMGPIYARAEPNRAVLRDPRQAPQSDPRTFPAWKMDRHADGGSIDPTFTPQQGGGATGIPSPPVMPQQPPRYALGATTGGTVPVHASPSGGAAVDDVPAMLTAHEFVIPKDVAMWMGHKALAGTIDKARKEQQQFAGRDDIGGEPTMAIPQTPTFVSRRIG